MSISPIPSGYPRVMPYLVVDDPERLLDFSVQAFEAEVIERMEAPDGSVQHAEIRIDDSVVMMGPSRPEFGAMPTMLYVYVENCDEDYARALDAGAESHQEPADMPYGDRTAAVKGPCGNYWYLATRKEKLTPEEIAERMGTSSENA